MVPIVELAQVASAPIVLVLAVLLAYLPPLPVSLQHSSLPLLAMSH